MTNNVFSEYELREQAVKFPNEESAQWTHADCVGSCEESLEVRTVTKNCRGVVAKTRTMGAGNGTLTMSLHMPYVLFKKMYGMEFTDQLAKGVLAYGQSSRHEEFLLVQHVYDEDGAEKFKAYPRCIIQTGIARSIENGAEEVAEIELEIALMPDDAGFCMYEGLKDELDESVSSQWMTAWTPELMKKQSELSLQAESTAATSTAKASVKKEG